MSNFQTKLFINGQFVMGEGEAISVLNPPPLVRSKRRLV